MLGDVDIIGFIFIEIIKSDVKVMARVFDVGINGFIKENGLCR